MVCVGSTLDINWSLFEYNSAGISGGGVYGVLCLMNSLLSVFRFNDAGDSGGGAMFFQSISNIVLDRVTVNNNYAEGPGGGLAAIECRSFFLTASSIFQNSASEGGGLYLIEILAPPEIQNDVIKDNTARDGGGGGTFCMMLYVFVFDRLCLFLLQIADLITCLFLCSAVQQVFSGISNSRFCFERKSNKVYIDCRVRSCQCFQETWHSMEVKLLLELWH